MDRIILILLGVWSLIFGFLAVTTFKIVWMEPIMGLSALVLGFVCLIKAFR